MKLTNVLKKGIMVVTLSCAALGVSMTAAADAPSPSPKLEKKVEAGDNSVAPKTGDHRPAPVYPIAASVALAGVVIVMGKNLKKEEI